MTKNAELVLEALRELGGSARFGDLRNRTRLPVSDLQNALGNLKAHGRIRHPRPTADDSSSENMHVWVLA